jgi:hypothetical protein
LSTTYISLTTEAELALAAAEQRLAKAHENLTHFLAEHAGNDALAEMLVIELDEAERFLRKCHKDLAELKAR